MKITYKQYEELSDTFFYDTRTNFRKKLEEITGIEARPYTAYQYFYEDNYIGDSDELTLSEILQKANIGVNRYE